MAAAATLAGLRDAIVAHFSLGDLDLLCADIDVNPDSVPRRDTIDARAQALLEFAARAGVLDRLLAACAARVPAVTVDWASFSAITRPAAGPASALTAGVNALAALARHPDARDTLSAFRADFESARAQIALLGAHKSLHELLQELEVRYAPLDADARRAASDPSAWDTLAQSIPEVSDIIGEITTQAADARLGLGAALWLTHLRQARTGLMAALDPPDPAMLASARADLKRGLSRGPSLVNTRLVATVDVLLQSNMAGRMLAARDLLAGQGARDDLIAQLNASLDALPALRGQLAALRDEHNGWQEVENQIGRIEDNLAADSAELIQTWPDVAALTGQLIGARAEAWADRLTKIAADTQAALTVNDLAAARRLFAQFASAAGRRFRRVDDELLEICNALQHAGAALDGLVRAIS